MSEHVGARPPGWFRLLAIVGILWDLIGVATYLQKVGMFGDPLAGLSDAERALAKAFGVVWALSPIAGFRRSSRRHWLAR
jgi:hypothetical protein